MSPLIQEWMAAWHGDVSLEKSLGNRYPGFTDHVVHPLALKQNQCIEFVILPGKFVELLLLAILMV